MKHLQETLLTVPTGLDWLGTARPITPTLNQEEPFLSIQGRLDRGEQCIFAERLAQEVHRTSGHRLSALAIVGAGGDKNNRNPLVGVRQISLQFQSVHSRHSHVKD